MKQWEDWIIFLGFRDEHYGNAVDAIGKWKGTLTGSGLNGDDLRRLNGLLFNGPDQIIQHFCCLGLSSMRVADNVIEAGWVDGGGLYLLHKEYERVKDCDFSDTYIYPYIGVGVGGRVSFFNDGRYLTVGMTLDGRIVIDTKEMYGGTDGQAEYRRTAGDREYCCRLLETVKKNYAGVLLPEVPKGILKLPDRL